MWVWQAASKAKSIKHKKRQDIQIQRCIQPWLCSFFLSPFFSIFFSRRQYSAYMRKLIYTLEFKVKHKYWGEILAWSNSAQESMVLLLLSPPHLLNLSGLFCNLPLPIKALLSCLIGQCTILIITAISLFVPICGNISHDVWCNPHLKRWIICFGLIRTYLYI